MFLVWVLVCAIWFPLFYLQALMLFLIFISPILALFESLKSQDQCSSLVILTLNAFSRKGLVCVTFWSFYHMKAFSLVSLICIHQFLLSSLVPPAPLLILLLSIKSCISMDRSFLLFFSFLLLCPLSISKAFLTFTSLSLSILFLFQQNLCVGEDLSVTTKLSFYVLARATL